MSPEQQMVVSAYLIDPSNWKQSKHGDKKILTENISVVFIAALCNEDNKNLLEAHRKFYDLHCTLEGNDTIAAKPLSLCKHVKRAYSEDGDYILFNEAPYETKVLPSGFFCLIPPADAHMALYGKGGFVKKIVFKIPV